jgi:hypothetical protein
MLMPYKQTNTLNKWTNRRWYLTNRQTPWINGQTDTDTVQTVKHLWTNRQTDAGHKQTDIYKTVCLSVCLCGSVCLSVCSGHSVCLYLTVCLSICFGMVVCLFICFCPSRESVCQRVDTVGWLQTVSVQTISSMVQTDKQTRGAPRVNRAWSTRVETTIRVRKIFGNYSCNLRFTRFSRKTKNYITLSIFLYFLLIKYNLIVVAKTKIKLD